MTLTNIGILPLYIGVYYTHSMMFHPSDNRQKSSQMTYIIASWLSRFAEKYGWHLLHSTIDRNSLYKVFTFKCRDFLYYCFLMIVVHIDLKMFPFHWFKKKNNNKFLQNSLFTWLHGTYQNIQTIGRQEFQIFKPSK